MQIPVKKLTETAKLPVYATEQSSGFDFFADINKPVKVYIDTPVIVPTGIAVQVPEGYGMLILSRSGHGFKKTVRLSNCVGLIDSDYRGEIKVALTKDTESGEPLEISPGERFAQGVIVPMPRVYFKEVEELADTLRGEGGFGSTRE